jgi:hypothetical protein
MAEKLDANEAANDTIENDETKFDYGALDALCSGHAAGNFGCQKRPQSRTGCAWFPKEQVWEVVWGTLNMRGVFEIAIRKTYESKQEAESAIARLL